MSPCWECWPNGTGKAGGKEGAMKTLPDLVLSLLLYQSGQVVGSRRHWTAAAEGEAALACT